MVIESASPDGCEAVLDPATVNGPVLRGLLDQIANALRCPVALQTPDLTVLEGVGEFGGVALVPSASRTTRAAIGRTEKTGGVVTLPPETDGPGRSLVPVRGAGTLLGYLVAGCDDSQWVRSVLTQGALLLAATLLGMEEMQADVADRKVGIVHELLTGAATDSIVQRAASVGYDLRVPHQAMVFALDDPEPHPAAHAAQLRRLQDMLFGQGGRPPHGMPHCLNGIDRERLVVFVPCRPAKRPEEVLSRALHAAAAWGERISVGTGGVCRGAHDYAVAAKQAHRAVDVLRLSGRKGAVLSHDELGVYGLLFSEADSDRLCAFVTRWIGPLLEHDAAHHAELTRTLEVVLERQTLAGSGEAISVHVSTVKYRLRRIEAILGVDLRNPTVAFNLQLALKVHRIQNDLLRNEAADTARYTLYLTDQNTEGNCRSST